VRQWIPLPKAGGYNVATIFKLTSKNLIMYHEIDFTNKENDFSESENVFNVLEIVFHDKW
jgi:hypothetical protein